MNNEPVTLAVVWERYHLLAMAILDARDLLGLAQGNEATRALSQANCRAVSVLDESLGGNAD